MQFAEGDEEDLLAPPDIDGHFTEQPPSSPAPEEPTAPPVTDATASQEKQESRDEPPLEFDPRFREDYEGLMFLGYLSKEIRFLGHRFTIRTVDIDTVLEVGLLHSPYVGTIADLKAYQTILAAACVTRLDGRPVAMPIGEDSNELADKFGVVRKWFPATINYIYDEYLILEARVDEIIEAMRKGHSSGGAVGVTDSTSGLTPASV